MSIQLSGTPMCCGCPACSGRYNNVITSGLSMSFMCFSVMPFGVSLVPSNLVSHYFHVC